jgi:hypothetical protein
MEIQTMNNILDLEAILSTDTLDIKLLDGSIIHLRKPTFKDYTTLQSFLQRTDTENSTVLIDFLLFILNSNLDNKQFTPDDLEGFNATMIIAIINAYLEYTQDITSNPFTYRQPSQQVKKAAQKK